MEKGIKVTKTKTGFTVKTKEPTLMKINLDNGHSFLLYVDAPVKIHKTSPIFSISKIESPTQLSRLSEGERASVPEGYPEDRSQYAVPEYYMFPIDTEKHVRSAIKLFAHHDWEPKENKKRAAQRILRAAKKFGVDVGEDSEVYRTAKEPASKDVAVGELGGISTPSL